MGRSECGCVSFYFEAHLVAGKINMYMYTQTHARIICIYSLITIWFLLLFPLSKHMQVVVHLLDIYRFRGLSDNVFHHD